MKAVLKAKVRGGPPPKIKGKAKTLGNKKYRKLNLKRLRFNIRHAAKATYIMELINKPSKDAREYEAVFILHVPEQCQNKRKYRQTNQKRTLLKQVVKH